MQIQQTVGDPKKLLENISYNMKEFSKKIQSMTFEKKDGTTFSKALGFKLSISRDYELYLDSGRIRFGQIEVLFDLQDPVFWDKLMLAMMSDFEFFSHISINGSKVEALEVTNACTYICEDGKSYNEADIRTAKIVADNEICWSL